MNIFVGNLHLDVTEDELLQEFRVFGEVTAVTIMGNKCGPGGQSFGYGFVEMALKSEGEAAISNLQGKELKGQAIDVIGALPLSHKREQGSIRNRRGRPSITRGGLRRY
jgi:RNA recognition motif-containing protein